MRLVADTKAARWDGHENLSRQQDTTRRDWGVSRISLRYRMMLCRTRAPWYFRTWWSERVARPRHR